VRLLGEAPQRQRVWSVGLDQSLGCVEQRFSGLLVVHSSAAHLDSLLQYRYVTS
jgi:hypothetical protein